MGIISKMNAADLVHVGGFNALSKTDQNLKVVPWSQKTEVGGMNIWLG